MRVFPSTCLGYLGLTTWSSAWTLCHSHSTSLTKSAKPDHARFTVAPLLHKAARKPALLAQPGRQPLPSTCHKLHHFYVHFTCSVITIRCLSWTGVFGCFRCPSCKVCNESVKKFDKIWQANPIEPSSVPSLAASHGSKDLAISGSTLLPCLGASNACIVHIVHVVHLFGFKLFQDVPGPLAIGAKVDILHNCITMLTLPHISQPCAVPRSAPALRASNP